jgi:hypothetical protein
MSTKQIGYLLLALVLGAVFIWSVKAGIAALVVVGVLGAVIWSGAMQDAEWTKKYGVDTAKKIRAKNVELGMKREVVELIWGKGANPKSRTNASGVMLQCDHQPMEENGRKRYRYYAVYQDDVLVEFGDR